jgi:hypothetical protein
LNDAVSADWVGWHQGYDTPGSSLGRRLEVVRRDLRRALGTSPCEPDGTRRLVSMCAGDGRDVLPVIAEHDRRVRALLVELDPVLAGRARETADDLGLGRVEIRTADAGQAGTYLDVRPAHILLACGVFGNVSDDDARRTVAALPTLLVAGGIVIWTRARGADGAEPARELQAHFAAHGFTELSYTAPADASFRVGMHRLAAATRHAALSGRLFTFR